MTDIINDVIVAVDGEDRENLFNLYQNSIQFQIEYHRYHRYHRYHKYYFEGLDEETPELEIFFSYWGN